MTSSEAQKLFDLAKAWQTAADLHKKEMRRNRSFAQPGKENYEFYLAKAAHDEIRAELFESHSKQLTDVVNELVEQGKSSVAESTA